VGQLPVALNHDSEFRGVFVDRQTFGADDQTPGIASLRSLLDSELSLEGRQYELWSAALDEISDALGGVGQAVVLRGDALRSEGQAILTQTEQLKSGRGITYSRELESFRFGLAEAIRRGVLRLRRPVVPLCELVTDVDPEWQDTAEGWLGQRRYDLIADPQDYAVVRDWYDQNRDACPTLDGRALRLFGVSVVNVAKVQQQRVHFAAEPLSSVLTTEDPLARAYIDLLLGGVQCCVSVQHLDSFTQSATATGFIYRGFRLDRVRTGPLASRVLGFAAREEQRRRLEQDLGAISLKMQALETINQWRRRTMDQLRIARDEWPRVVSGVLAIAERDSKKAEIGRITVRLSELDLSHIAPLKRAYEDAKKRHNDVDVALTAARQKGSDARAAIKTETTLAEASERRSEERSVELDDYFPAPDFDPRWIEHRARFDERVAEAIEKGDTLLHVAANYRTRVNAATTHRDETYRTFTGLHAAYENTYGPLPVGSRESAMPIRLEADRWRNTRLPEYQRQIEERIREARVQLLDDVLAQLHSHFADLRKALGSLNDALRVSLFGRDLYEFTYAPAPDLREYYELLLTLAGYFNAGGGSQGSAYELFETRADLRERLDSLLDALTA
ncbi:MAG: hypothetical protein ACREBE_14720, partial [bacterium]